MLDNIWQDKKLQKDKVYITYGILSGGFYSSSNDIVLSSSPLRFDINTFLSNKYITSIKDSETNRQCKGYSTAYINNYGNRVIKAYIKCDNYTSKGYGE